MLGRRSLQNELVPYEVNPNLIRLQQRIPNQESFHSSSMSISRELSPVNDGPARIANPDPQGSNGKHSNYEGQRQESTSEQHQHSNPNGSNTQTPLRYTIVQNPNQPYSMPFRPVPQNNPITGNAFYRQPFPTGNPQEGVHTQNFATHQIPEAQYFQGPNMTDLASIRDLGRPIFGPS